MSKQYLHEHVLHVLLSRYIERLPLMFIFGIATSPSTIQHLLPHSVSSLLCIELFQSLSCTQHLATVIDKVVFHSHTVQCKRNTFRKYAGDTRIMLWASWTESLSVNLLDHICQASIQCCTIKVLKHHHVSHIWGTHAGFTLHCKNNTGYCTMSNNGRCCNKYNCLNWVFLLRFWKWAPYLCRCFTCFNLMKHKTYIFAAVLHYWDFIRWFKMAKSKLIHLFIECV